MVNLKDLHILVVDDSHANRLLLKARLKKLQADILLAEDGLQALELLEQETFDLIFLDIQMPRMDGFAVLDQIRKRGIDAPVIAWTCSVSLTNQHLIDAGFDDCLDKPLDCDNFYQVLEKHLRLDGKGSDPEQDQTEVLALEFDLISKDIINSILHLGKQLPGKFQEIYTIIQDQDWEEAIFLTYKLRGTCKLHRYTQIAEVLKQLQTSIEEEDYPRARSLVQQLITAGSEKGKVLAHNFVD